MTRFQFVWVFFTNCSRNHEITTKCTVLVSICIKCFIKVGYQVTRIQQGPETLQEPETLQGPETL